MKERQKMLAGELYDASDPELVSARQNARLLLTRLNIGDTDPNHRYNIYKSLFGTVGDNAYIQPPFYCDYGSNIFLGDRVFFNFNCVILDPATVHIGDDVLFGPGVQVYTATHPLDWRRRSTGLESAKPVRIGANVWIGGGAIVCPGVEIGPRSVIGAGSVVTKNIPADVLAAGNPCRVIRELR